MQAEVLDGENQRILLSAHLSDSMRRPFDDFVLDGRLEIVEVGAVTCHANDDSRVGSRIVLGRPKHISI